jgi:hypothetical protein
MPRSSLWVATSCGVQSSGGAGSLASIALIQPSHHSLGIPDRMRPYHSLAVLLGRSYGFGLRRILSMSRVRPIHTARHTTAPALPTVASGCSDQGWTMAT